MGKLLVLYLLIPFYLKFRYRKSPRIGRNVERWFFLFTAGVALLIAPWGTLEGTLATAVKWIRLAAAVGFLGYLLYDIRRAVRPATSAGPRGAS